MTLQTQLLVSRGSFVLDAAVSVAPGETLALLGPNGSGKSTMLAAIAGLLLPDRGTITVDGRVLTQVPRAARSRMTVVPAHQRRVGLLGQNPLLFPHLNALENVAFGLRAQGMKVAEARARAAGWVDAVGLSSLAGQRPEALSGGQQQRIAIARVLATEPDVLLFDEPMAALDVQNASLVRTLLRECLADWVSAPSAPGAFGERRNPTRPATIVVTHDVVDAMVLADRVAILEHGRIVDIGDVGRVLGQPANLFAATLVGLNLLEGIVETPELVRMPDGRSFASNDELPALGTEVSVVFPPSAVSVCAAPTGSSERDRGASRRGASSLVASLSATPNSWQATIDLLEPAANGIRVVLRADAVTAEASPAELLAQHLSLGDLITASVNPAFVTVYPRRAVARSV